MGSNGPHPFQYAAFVDPETGNQRIGHLDLGKKAIYPVSFISGTPIENLYQVIEAGPSNIAASLDAEIPVNSVKLLAPISGRDVLAVGKNYMEHAKEFNSSGYDSSDKVDLPSHPVIFTKRATSIIADGDEISPHHGFTDSVDYEGEIGVIIGKPGYQISEQNAWDHVWGYTIINDVTARERQRDHKQFYIGKSPDTFCPMVGQYSVLRQSFANTTSRDQLRCRRRTSRSNFVYRPLSMAKRGKMALPTTSSSRFLRWSRHSQEDKLCSQAMCSQQERWASCAAY